MTFHHRSLIALGAVLLLHCKSPSPTAPPASPSPPQPGDPLAGGKPHVLVEGLLVEGPAQVEPPAANLTELAAHAGTRIVTSPHILASDGERATINVGAPGDGLRMNVVTHVLEGDRVDLDVELDFEREGDGGKLVHTFHVRSGELTSFDLVPREGGRRYALALEPAIVRSRDDLRRIYGEKMRARHAALGKSAPAAPPPSP
jgi:hypothetical protein